MDAALLRAVLLPRVRCGQELPAVGKLQAADSPHYYFSEISQLSLEDMVNAEFITAANCHVIAQRMQTETVYEL